MRRSILLLILTGIAACGLFMPGCDDLVTETTEETVAGNPTADFGVVADSGCLPLSVEFKDLSDGPRNKWTWYFGDGDSSNDTNPIHIYDSVGTYTCSLRIEDTTANKTDTEVKKRFIIVGHLLDSFTTDIDSGCPGLEVTFTPYGYGGIDSWLWDFGDGAPKADSAVTSHIYSRAGQFQAKLTAKGDCGQAILVDTITITDCPRVSFVADIGSGCVPLTVSFADSSDVTDTHVVLSRLWNFGNDLTSTDQNPTVIFDSAGTYSISLTVVSSGGTASLERADFITVYDSTTADFTTVGSRTACLADASQFLVWFVDSSRGDIDSIRWYFGDGTTDTVSNPVHAYTAAGGYEVSLEAYGPCGADTLTTIDYVLLYDSLASASFSYTVDPLDSKTYTFVDESAGFYPTRLWDFGTGGDTSPLTQTTFTFPEAGTYVVSLTISNDCNSAVAESTLVVVE